MKKSVSAAARLLPLAILLCSLCSLCGCTDDSVEAEPEPSGYNMIADGTSVYITEPPVQETDDNAAVSFYVPRDMVTVYGSENLTEKEKQIYDSLVESVGNFEEIVPLELDGATYTKLLNLICVEQLSFSHLTSRRLGDYNVNTNTFDVVLSYRFSPEEMSNMNRVSEAKANEIIDSMDEGLDEYEKIKFLHDYLVRTCESTTDDKYANTIYGALIQKKALCEGYAKAFSYLCNKAGIENMIVTGQTSVPHMWNMVKLDGNWYHVDVTWDKPGGTLLERYPDMILYQYFMVTDAVIENDHTIVSIERDAPQAFGTKDNYFEHENFYIRANDDAAEIIRGAFEKAVADRKCSAMVKFDATNLMLTFTKQLKSTSADGSGGFLKDTIELIKSEYNVNLSIGWTDYYSDYRILVFTIDYIE